ncbi:MAG: hypothetical protein ACJ72N_25690 [Labedaea sp.]
MRASRERPLGRMAAAVTGLEQARAELVELIATMSIGESIGGSAGPPAAPAMARPAVDAAPPAS